MSQTIRLFVLFVSISLCRGNTGSIPDGLLERIVALEQREKVLENRVFFYNTELENLKEANFMLRQDLKETTTQLQDKTTMIEEANAMLRQDLKEKTTQLQDKTTMIEEANAMLRQDLKETTTQLQDKTKMIEKVTRDMEDMKQKSDIQQEAIRALQNEVTQLKQTEKILNEEEKVSNQEQEENNGENIEHLYETNGIFNYTGSVRKDVPKPLNIHKFAKATNQQMNGEVRKRSSLMRQGKSLSGSVAFHAVVTSSSLSHLGTTQPIIFNYAHLNLGNGYHKLHGIFIAPKSGLYMFSVTIATYSNKYFYANLVKDGSLLARLSGPSVSQNSQGSVTVVTQLNQGSEVWVVHTSPTDGYIHGQYYTSFCGILLIEA